MNRISPVMLMLLTLFAFACPSLAYGGFTVLSWSLDTFLLESAGPHIRVDSDDILEISNPLTASALAQIDANTAAATHDHAWIEDLAVGDFNTSFTHEIRSPEVNTISTSAITITADEPLRILIDGEMTYSHTPGDLDSFNFFAAIRDEATFLDVFEDQTLTGELYFAPPADTLTIDAEVILPAGGTYRLRYGLDSANTADLLPTGTMDATGYVNFAVRPLIPEPGAALLLCAALPLILRRRRRD